MLESNAFRVYMLIGSFLIISMITYLFISVDVIYVDDDAKKHYNSVMSEELAESDSHITSWEAINYWIHKHPGSGTGANHY